MTDVAVYPDPDEERGMRDAIRAQVRTPGIMAYQIAKVTSSNKDERQALPIRLPKMYYEALKEYSRYTNQSMNAIVVEAIGNYLKQI